jgi:hypothetical protein
MLKINSSGIDPLAERLPCNGTDFGKLARNEAEGLDFKIEIWISGIISSFHNSSTALRGQTLPQVVVFVWVSAVKGDVGARPRTTSAQSSPR